MMEQITGFGNATQNLAPMAPKPVDYSNVRVKIIEQPASHKLRFRSVEFLIPAFFC